MDEETCWLCKSVKVPKGDGITVCDVCLVSYNNMKKAERTTDTIDGE